MSACPPYIVRLPTCTRAPLLRRYTMDQPYQPDDYDYKYPPSVASSRTFTDDKYEPNRLEPLLYDNTSAHSDETRTSKASQRTRRRITGADATVAFHAALILQYLILIVIWIPHWEHRTTIGLSKRSDMLRAMVTQLQALVAAVNKLSVTPYKF